MGDRHHQATLLCRKMSRDFLRSLFARYRQVNRSNQQRANQTTSTSPRPFPMTQRHADGIEYAYR